MDFAEVKKLQSVKEIFVFSELGRWHFDNESDKYFD